jgi:aminopeptidase N
MKKILLAFLILTSSHVLFAQEEENTQEVPGKKVYRETYTRINDLVHTQLDIRFDYSKSQAAGKVWITLKPHFYATDSLNLDAKGMDIHTVAIMKGAKAQTLKYNYNGNNLFITLDKTYTANEQYIIYIEYTAKPNDYKAKGSMAITDAKGLYFINPLGTEKNKPTQIWTQGETDHR